MTNWKQIDTYVRQWLKEARLRIFDSFQKTLDIQTKSDRNDLVTNIDKETEEFFTKNIAANFPDHHIVGEEGFGDTIDKTEGILWIIDPIDGTVNFVHQQRNFAISIGIYENGKGRLGYIYDVVHDELYFVESGKGAYFNDTPIAKMADTKVSDAIIGINSSWLIANRHIPISNLHALVRDSRAARSIGAASLEFAYVATGRLDAYISMRLSPWDFAAGRLLVEELGGVVTTVKGELLQTLKSSTVFVSNKGLHEEILKQYLLK
ncbi:inositol monophosphatase family protein [Heyndrickxia sp. NPDC080065]|uniref:inositol monophosphatase family protein n=1 Tax=Heyndrickxia sp. NPDC080065 TaxID=3390568 RepID=UPI003D048E9C